MKFLSILFYSFALFIFCILNIPVNAQNTDQPLKWLSFDRLEEVNDILHYSTIKDLITDKQDTIRGTYTALKEGVSGKSLLLDGYSAYVYSGNIPKLHEPFTIEGWFALGAYPKNFAPIAEQNVLSGKGFSLGINHEGIPSFKIATEDGWITADGEAKIPLLTWTHICGVYNENNIYLYINGRIVASKSIKSKYLPADNELMFFGMSSNQATPVGALREFSSKKVNHFIDGLIDEIKLWDKALSSNELQAYYKKFEDLNSPDLKVRHLPYLPELNSFGAINTNLEFYESWDKFWRTSGLPDIVVYFDKLNAHLVFWRGTSYIPHWVINNELWYNDEFNETWSDINGCLEPMQDRRCQYSNVKIIENTPARCIVHWRYALNDIWYGLANVDSMTGWGDWSDEIYTIYPDGVAVRSQTLHSSRLTDKYEWHESMIIMGQGQRPEDILSPQALIMSNMEGQEHIFSWENVEPNTKKEGVSYIVNRSQKDRYITELPGANIQVVNTLSSFKPFVIVNPDDKPIWDLFLHELRRDVSIFPWWNHWPTAFVPSDGQYAMESDRASHSSLGHLREWKAYRKTSLSETRLTLVGLTGKSASELIPLTKSWSHAPGISVQNNNIKVKGYNPEERAYQIECLNPEACKILTINLSSSSEHPSINPAFVIENWKKKDWIIKIDGKKLKDNDIIRCGFTETATGTRMILWINETFDKPVNIEIYSR